MYLLQNMSVAISAGAAVVALYLDQRNSIFWGCVACTMLLGSVSSAGALGATLSVEREWTKALCQGNSASLAKLNAGAQPHARPSSLPTKNYRRRKWPSPDV